MIFVNCRFLEQDLTGVQRFALEICLALQKIRDDLVFVAPKTIKQSAYIEQLDIKIIGEKGGLYWEQAELTCFLKKNGNPLLLNLCNRAPLFYKNNLIVLHDITFIRYPQSHPFLFILFYKTIIPLLIKRCQKLFTVSHFSRKEIAQHYKLNLDCIGIIYNATNTHFVPSPKNKGIFYLLAVSSDLYHKNFRNMIDAFLHINNLPELKLVIIGGQGKVTKEYENEENIIFLGRVSDSELIELYQQALAFIFPSFYEGFGIPPLEAQACGCPVLSSNMASMPEVLENSALYFDPFDINSIEKAIRNIFENKELRKRLIQEGFDNIKRFSWQDSAIMLSQELDAQANFKDRQN